MAAIANTMVSKLLNASTPTGTSGAPGSFGTALGTGAMKVRLNSGSSSASAAGTEITGGSGYTTGGQAVPAASTASSSGSSVTLPASSALTWTNSGSTWSIQSMDLTDSAGVRCWFGDFNGAPISVANGNTFRIDVAAVTISLT